MNSETLPKLLRAIAGGTSAKESRHDVIFNAAADEIERLKRQSDGWYENYCALAKAIVGDTGLSAMQEAHRLRALHPLKSVV